MKSRMLVWFSCGAASAVSAKIAVDHYAGDYQVEVLYCDLLSDEHPDNARFLGDVERWIGQPIKLLHHNKYRTVEDVILGQRYIVGVAGAPCTRLLKQQVRIEYQRHDDVHVLGFTADEAGRASRFESRWPELDCEWILVDRGIDKDNCLDAIRGAGIELPAMYRLGYHHNNCIGCVKGGMGYWNKIRRDFPERFAKMAALEREIGASIIRASGKSVYLDELDPDRGRHDDLTIDCGMFCEARQASVELKVSSRKR